APRTSAQDTASTRRRKDTSVKESDPERCDMTGSPPHFEGTRTQGPRMTSAPDREICLNGVRYRWPDRPVVVVCDDGSDPAYFDRALADGSVPNVARFMETGFSAIAQCVIPSFTCPNNVSIVTGSPPSIHGISGNFYLERETGNAVVMTGPELMRSTT